MLHIGAFFIVIALICYTIAVWTERRKKTLLIWMIGMFALGFICDTIGTFMMFVISKTKFHLTIHSGVGYVALAIMLIHLIWAILSIQKIGKYEEYFTRFSIVA
ncbi:MAG: HsmA family protein [bacterium]